MTDLLERARAKGSDKEYREWIQRQASCISGEWSEWLPDIGEWRNPACHVRRANEFGTGFKAEFACVPMTHAEHRLQTDKGEASVLSQHLGAQVTVEEAKEWFDEQRIEYLERWIRGT